MIHLLFALAAQRKAKRFESMDSAFWFIRTSHRTDVLNLRLPDPISARAARRSQCRRAEGGEHAAAPAHKRPSKKVRPASRGWARRRILLFVAWHSRCRAIGRNCLEYPDSHIGKRFAEPQNSQETDERKPPGSEWVKTGMAVASRPVPPRPECHRRWAREIHTGKLHFNTTILFPT